MAVLAGLSITVWSFSPLSARLQQEHELATLQRKKAHYQKENKKLKIEIARLKKDPEHIEMLARKNFGFIKSGEEAYVVIEDKQAFSAKPAAKEADRAPSVWQLVKEKISELSPVF